MKLRWKLFILGILIGSVGPLSSLFVQQVYSFLNLVGIDTDSFFLTVYPFSLIGMAFDGAPSSVQIVVIVVLSTLNLGFFGGIGFLLGWFLEKLKGCAK